MYGVTKASRGEARGDAKGDAVEDLLRNTAEDEGVRFEGRGEAGVEARATCQGAGDDLRITVCREGGRTEAKS